MRAIRALENLEHRGATGADPKTGDGAGITIQLPDEFFRGVVGAELPPAGSTASPSASCRATTRAAPSSSGSCPTLSRRRGSASSAGATSRSTSPTSATPRRRLRPVSDTASSPPHDGLDPDAFERKLYVIRRVAELAAGPDLVFPSFSSRTIVYKGMLMAPQLLGAYPDLQDERVKSALALVHSRFSTNTFPSWELAHPYRMIAHNGEINTLRGNVNWMRARESQLASELFGDDLRKVLPVVREGGSDSANFDNVLELLVLAGRSLPHAMMMMIPEAYAGRDDVSDELRGFYDFHGCLMEPWDGPAAIAFTDGRVIGATLDRNGLRPGRWLETKDGWVVLASETGVLDIPAENVLRKGRLQPGKLFLVDVDQHRIVADEEVKREIATRKPYKAWFEVGNVHLADLPERPPRVPRGEPLRSRQLAFGYVAGRPEGDPDAARAQRRGGDRLDGQRPRARRPLRPAAAPLQLLQAALRAGDEPADRLDARVDRDERRDERRLRAQPARRDARARTSARDRPADPAQRGAREPAPGRLVDLQGAHDRHHLAGRRRRRRASRRRSRGSAPRPTACSRSASTS